MGKELTAERARELLDYDHETGVLTWKWRPDRDKSWNTRYAGKEAGTTTYDPNSRTTYRQVSISKVLYMSHRIIWLLVTGEHPANDIDHEDGDGSNNKFINLREATSLDNHRNYPLARNNSSGRTGVTWFQKANKWAAQIHCHGKHIHLGLFASLEDAIAAREKAEIDFGFHPNHGRAANPGEPSTK